MSGLSHGGVAVVFDDLTEFFGMREAIDVIIDNEIDIDIYVPLNYSEDLRSDTKSKIIQLGYSVKDEFDIRKKYKVLLEPYPIVSEKDLTFDFRLKYRYAPISAKPSPVYSPEWNMPYDAFIVYNKRDAEAFSVYGKTHIVPYFKFHRFKKKSHSGKPNLLYLPTFGDSGSIEDINEDDIEEIKKTHKLVVKAHHALQFQQNERVNYERLKKLADEFYDSDVSLPEILASSDVVLSDNSSAVFDAIYSETPVVIFSTEDKLNKRRLGAINTPQFELVKDGIVPCVHSSDQIVNAITSADKLLQRQKEVKFRSFIVGVDESSSYFFNIIEEYLNRNREDGLYFLSKDILLGEWKEGLRIEEEAIDMRSEIARLTRENDIILQHTNDVVSSYENSVSWALTRPLREIKRVLSEQIRGNKG